ncbi:MAG: hypothetical protein HC803_07900 [Saprospiraceae bacterium]|nr:hypothetical protein [Saprospiraceae bacterium]
MILHLKEYVNRLKKYSQQLDNFAVLTDQPWVTNFDNPTERCVYIFRNKDSQLITSTNGNVKKGTWDYLPSMKSLLIELGDKTTLYNQGFLDNSIMILRRDGTDEHQLFVNENKIETTIEKLLQKVEKNYLSQTKTEDVSWKIERGEKVVKFISDSGELKIFTRKEQGYEVGDKIMVNNKVPKDGKIKMGYWNYILVENGRIKKIK